MSWRSAVIGLDAARLDEITREYTARAERDRAKLERMIMMMYAQTAQCRWSVLLDYFGAAPGAEPCGHCDNCVAPPSSNPSSIAAR